MRGQHLALSFMRRVLRHLERLEESQSLPLAEEGPRLNSEVFIGVLLLNPTSHQFQLNVGLR